MTTIECHCLHLEEPWLNAGIRTSSQPTLYVGWDVATEAVKVFLLFPLFSKEGLGEI